MRRRALATTSFVAALGLVMVSATSASAAELPASDELYTISSDALYTTSSAGVLTYVADVPEPGNGKYGADFDVTTGNAYFFVDDSNGCTLYSLVPATGVSTLIGPVSDASIDECDALNVDSAGVLRIADQDGGMVTVNKTTAAIISTVTVTGIGAISFIEQASTGQFYAGDYDGSLYTLDVTTGATVFLAQPVTYIETASFDSTDTLWFSEDGDSCQGLGSVSIAVPGTATVQGDFEQSGSCVGDIYAMFIAPAADEPVTPIGPELADTGASAVDIMLLTGLLVLVMGAGAVAASRRVRVA